jgi:class 3 adenylate cyclase
VETAEDGYRALEAVAAGRFDLVLLDIMMPGLNGYEVLKTLREKLSMSELPVIMATAKDQGEDIVLALRLGANDYVTKPLDFAVVIARVKTQLALKHAIEQVRLLAQELEVRNQFIRKTFGRYLSDDVVAGLLGTPDGLALGGEKRTLTLLMSDIRGFSAVSERLTPEQVVLLLNRYLGAMAEVITRHRGTIDEFIGDAILALFGAPLAGEDDASRAVACAVDMQLRMAAVNAENRSDGLPELQMGIAVNTGEVVVGNIGSEARAKYGVVGSPVNLTARIESCTLGGQVFVSETTLAAVGSILEVGARMTMDVKGFDEPITFYDVRRVGAPYGLALPERRAALVRLAAPLPLRFSVLEGKHVSDHGHEGSMIRLGAGEAELSSDYRPQALTNLRVRLCDQAQGEMAADLYVKVVDAEAEAGGFRVGFTSVPPEIEAVLEGLRVSR